MWIFCKLGFFSAVQHREKPDVLLVRARIKGDLERLIRAIPRDDLLHFGQPKVEITPDADYRYRAEIYKAVFSELLRDTAESIDYDNFKNAAHDGTVRDEAYMDVWRAMWSAQNFPKNRRKVI